MYPEFNGRTVLVTGGSRGIGAATAAAFAAEGARVWVVGRDRQALDDTVAGIEKEGGTAFAAVADVTSLAALEAVRDQVGPVDVLAAFAGGGIARPGPTAAMTEQEWGAPVAYAAAKAGIIMLTKHVAAEVGRDNVRVNCVSPSSIRVERMAQIPMELQEKIAATHPLARIGEPSDVATTSLFLASDGASWLTGLTIDIAGGRITN
jgi:3-oxoacyl-[acyl-carrier protein] reductase